MACCRNNCGMSPKIMQQIEDKLKEVGKIFPGTTFCCILNSDGEIIAQSDKHQKVAEDYLAPISSLKKAACQFGATLHQMECPLIHIRGNSHMFSCYDIEENLLAFYTEMHSAILDGFNTTEADVKMKTVVQDLRLLVLNLVS